MILGCIVAAILLAIVLCLVTLVQLFYMESLRLRTRDLPSLQFFKDNLQDRLGARDQAGVLVFSLVKHTSLLLLVVCFIAASANKGTLRWIDLAQDTLFAWLTMLVSTYVLPQLLYRKTSGHWLVPLVPVLRAIALVVRPLAALLGFFQSLVDLAQPGQAEVVQSTTTEHIEALINAGEEEGIIEKEDRKLIHSVVAFGDKTVREVMTPRPDIIAIEASRSLEDLRELVIHEQYSRIPVYEGTIDQVIGFIHVRDMFELDEQERKVRTVRELMRPIRSVPETKAVNDLLREMQHDGAHMDIVVDEYGNTAGLVTMEDMVEEILGEIHDEHEPERDVTEAGEGTFIVAGSLDLDRLHDLLDFRPPSDTESTTVGGLVTEWLGHVPRAGESVEREGIRIEVLAGNELRVDQVRVSRAETKSHA